MADTVVAVVDDDDAVRISTCALLESVGHVSYPFASGDALLADFPDSLKLILLDLHMPGTDGLGVLKKLQTQKFEGSVLMLTGHGDIEMAVKAMRLGAVDFLEKPYDAADLLQRIEWALASAPGSAGIVFDENAAQLLASLSPRQLDVLKGIAGGFPNKVIAHRLGLSTRTVEAYRAQLLDRMRARNTAEVVKLALMGGLDCA